tara:strand:+ start:160 stop:1161 length:1002 start_codon:yes stop_codon:yes gene_type:complete
MKNKKILNIGLIGCGVVGLRRIENLSNNFKLIGCADIKVPKKKFINKKKLFITSNWKKLINLKNLDAVIIATTHQLHTQIILECIKIGIHVFVEKPGGISAIETNRIISFYKKKKNYLNVRVGFNHRYHPAFLKAKELINDKLIGKILYIRAVYGHGGRLNYEKEWRFRKKISGGGELIDKGSHLIDLARFFLGDLEIISSKLKNFFWKMKLEDNCFLNLENKNGSIAFLHASCTEWKNKFLFEIFGQFGKIEINGLGKSYGEERLIIYKMLKKMGKPFKKEFRFKKKDYSWKKELDEFYIDITKKKVSSPGLIDIYKNLKIINEIYNNNDNN